MKNKTNLNKYIKELTDPSGVEDQQFTLLIKKSEELLGLSSLELARKMMVAGPTIKRWKEGRNYPHKLMRPGALSFLKKEAEKLL